MVATTNLSDRLADRNSEEFQTLFSRAIRAGWTAEQLGYLVDRPNRYADEYRKLSAAEALVNAQGRPDIDADEVELLDCEPDEAVREWSQKNVTVTDPNRLLFRCTPDYVAVDYSGSDWEPKRLLSKDEEGVLLALSPTRVVREDGRVMALFEIGPQF